jgi:hypothetical protein
VNLVGFAFVISVARLSAYFKSQPWKTASRRVEQAEPAAPMKGEVRS